VPHLAGAVPGLYGAAMAPGKYPARAELLPGLYGAAGAGAELLSGLTS